MTAYAIAHLRKVTIGPEIIEYLENIEETLAPYGGRYLVHGGEKTVLEGRWPGDIIILEFPDRSRAGAWYHSPAYQQIAALRRNSSEGDVVIVEPVGEGHRATDVLRR